MIKQVHSEFMNDLFHIYTSLSLGSSNQSSEERVLERDNAVLSKQYLPTLSFLSSGRSNQ